MKREINTQFFTFRQNNSGGRFRYDKNLTETVVIEAINAADANAKAEALGIYFDGVEGGSDCQSCGDRWDRVYDSDGTDKPMYYGDEITEDYKPRYGGFGNQEEPFAYIHYYDGTKATIQGK